MTSKSITITIPEQLEEELKKEAEGLGISRSRFIGNLLLNWQEKRSKATNRCRRQKNGWCAHFGMACRAPQSEAKTCAGYTA